MIRLFYWDYVEQVGLDLKKQQGASVNGLKTIYRPYAPGSASLPYLSAPGGSALPLRIGGASLQGNRRDAIKLIIHRMKPIIHQIILAQIKNPFYFISNQSRQKNGQSRN